MEHFDAIVVGGGPGGATAAQTLAMADARVLVLDAARFPRTKLCAGWVTSQVWKSLDIQATQYPGTLQPFARATLELGGRVRETRWPRTVSYGILRREFDHYLLQRAEDSGATVRTGIRVDTPRRESGLWQISLGETEACAPMLIGAGGHRCPVARHIGEIQSDEPVVVARESETRLDPASMARITQTPGVPELVVEEDLNGYGWIFSKGDYLNIGLGCIDAGHSLNQRCDDFLDGLRKRGRLPADLALEPLRGHAYVVRMRAPRRPSGDGWLLVGDAAGLARPLSGEGIGPAVRSGHLAARMILDGTPEKYPGEIEQAFGSGEPGPLGSLIGQLPRSLLNGFGRIVCHQAQLRRKLIFEGAFGMREEADQNVRG